MALGALKVGKTATKRLLRQCGIDIRKVGSRGLQERQARAAAQTLLNTVASINLDVGAGSVKGRNGWLTIDQCDGADLQWDLNLALPFPEGSVSRIYSSHVLEHFFYWDMRRPLSDWYRVLKPGGSLSVCVPNAAIYVHAYVEEESLDPLFLEYKPAVISDLKMDWLNYIAYMDGHHRFMFDQANLLKVLTEAGFVDVQSRGFDPSLDMIERQHQSIYALAGKAFPASENEERLPPCWSFLTSHLKGNNAVCPRR